MTMKTDTLARKLVQLEQALTAHNKQQRKLVFEVASLHKIVENLQENMALLTSQETFYRYASGKQDNRTVKAPAKTIAYALHLMDKHRMPLLTLKKYGIMSYSKAEGLQTWTKEFVHDFLYVHRVQDVYESGLSASELPAITPKAQEFAEHLNKLNIILPQDPLTETKEVV